MLNIGTIIALIILIISTIYTAKLWLWIYKTAFGIKNKNILLISSIIGGLAAGSILFFPKIMNYLNIADFTQYNFSLKNLFIFILYLNSISIIFTLIFGKFSKKQLVNLIIFDVYFIFIFMLLKKINIDLNILNVILYYLFVAYGEEIIKNQLAFSINNKFGEINTDLLLYHILAAIGFAFWENIIYIIGNINFQTFITALFGGLSIVIIRGLLGFGAHSFYSSLIGRGNILGILNIIIYILLGILIHYGYNLALYFDYKIIIPIFIIIIYLWVSWIFYKIDRLYIENN